jgi:uncharacterized protein (DUF2147 family)
MRLIRLLVIGVVAFLNAVPALALGPQDIYGVWKHPDNGSLIQIYPCDGSICARIVSVPNPAVRDAKNPDPALRGRPVTGVETWRHARETAPLQWSGSAYNPADGATVYGTLKLTGETSLAVASCNLDVMPCFEQTWMKLPPEIVSAIPSLAWQPQLAQPAGATPKEGPATGDIATAKPGHQYKHRASKRKEPAKNNAATSPDASSDNVFSQLHWNW